MTNTDNYTQVLEQICTDTIRQFATEVDSNGAFPRQALGVLKDAGLMGAVSSAEVGGLALGARGAATIVQRVAQECGSTAMVLCMHFCGTSVLEAHASHAVRKAAASGHHLSTLAFSEAGSRSHFWAPGGTATRSGNDVILNARKSWCTSASEATAYVWSSMPLAADGLSSIWLVPAQTAGISRHGPFNGLGLRGNDSSPISADDVHLPESALLGQDGKGFDIMMGIVLPLFCVLNAACSLGLVEAAVARTVGHALTVRHQDTDTGLANLPTIRSYIARIKIKADLLQTLLDDTLSAVETGRTDTMLRVLECKAAAGETANEVLDIAMRVCGGAAFRKDVGVERYFRDARASGIMAPTTDVLYDFIGKVVCGMNLF